MFLIPLSRFLLLPLLNRLQDWLEVHISRADNLGLQEELEEYVEYYVEKS
jgi:hypothetical protein